MKKMVGIFCMCLLAMAGAQSQSSYPSLLWEISGNGLQKPSYLFGTMHVSSKMVFHLSDSFYNAIASCDMVSLEVDPKRWQPEMFRLQQSQAAMLNYAGRTLNDFLRETSFRINGNYEDKLKQALSEEPLQANGLLYRTYAPQADFQENTYLDLYIYQTARKLGKPATGVENYIESEKINLEALEDMAKEKRKPILFNPGENIMTIQKKIQDAYRHGDLSTLDSLSKLTATSEAYNEKFLYKRNEIQANSIDSIIQHQSLFVGVGAAHLPGNRGVIELLRRKGYTLRPVSMADEDATQREKIDKMKVPVTMQESSTPDGFVHVQLPGALYKRTESAVNESWQYSDMENGSYYMVTRIKTHAGLLGQTEEDVFKKIDNALYEYIPGKIIERKTITKNGYKGFDILNKTRRGDLQRYNIFITSSEIILFKVSGTDEYVKGKEGDDFFASVRLKETPHKPIQFTPSTGGFTVSLPAYPDELHERTTDDRLDTWQYETEDVSSGTAYMITTKSLHNYRFLEEDTLDLHLMEESIKSSDIIKSETSRRQNKIGGYTSLEMEFSLKDGGILKARAVIKGPQYYLLVARSKNAQANTNAFFSSFAFRDFDYRAEKTYTDPSLHFSVRTPVQPLIDNDLNGYVTSLLYNNPLLPRKQEAYVAETQTHNACFKNDSTGEAVQVIVSTLPAYFHRVDQQKFWENEMHWNKLAEDLIVDKKEWSYKANAETGYTFTLLDTNTNRKIKGLTFVKANTIYKMYALEDNLAPESSFIHDFFATFHSTLPDNGYTMFESKAPLFMKNYSSKDSLTHKMAREAIAHINFEGKDLPLIKQYISKIRPSAKNYIELKSRFIHAIGRMSDTMHMNERVSFLEEIYKTTADTTTFQNAAVLALAHIHSAQSFAALKNIFAGNPVIFETPAEYNDLFIHISDSLQLARIMFPDILQLSSIEDYKTHMLSLMVRMVDSGYLKKEDYAPVFNSVFTDAQIALRKIQSRNERVFEEKDENENVPIPQMQLTAAANNTNAATENRLNSYAVLLAPFYSNPSVQKFFGQLLSNRDKRIQLNTAITLIKNNIAIPDTLLNSLAANDRYRAQLLERLEKIKKENLFPEAYKKQQDMALSLLLNAAGREKFAEVEPLGKQFVSLKDKKGYVYFFKYKLQKNGDWLMGFAGIQPADEKSVNANRLLVSAVTRRLQKNEPEQQQFETRLQQLVTAKRKSAVQFYTSATPLSPFMVE